MGYVTDFSVSVTPPIEGLDDLLADASGYPQWDGGRNGGIKWYEHEADMRRLSEQFPKHLFQMHGVGGSHDDSWIEYYGAGKMQRCEGEIVYPEFDESLMT